ncbi:MAG: type II secretion system protein GspC, partial [Desulfococcaceae bacterium]
LKQTALKLRLWGTVTGDKDRAYAVIEEEKKRSQNLFREGDTLEGATVKQILREKIVLTVGGKDEILSMEKPPAGENPRLSRAMPTAGGAPNPFARAAGDSAPSGSKRIALGRAEVEDAVNNVNTLMRQARIRPHFKDGKPDGLTLSRIQRDSIFTKLGLRTGDVIVGVDGQQIESVDDALKFYNSLKSSPNVQLQIRRRGQLQNIDYAIE